jgi:hypothetical protein
MLSTRSGKSCCEHHDRILLEHVVDVVLRGAQSDATDTLDFRVRVSTAELRGVGNRIESGRQLLCEQLRRMRPVEEL